MLCVGKESQCVLAQIVVQREYDEVKSISKAHGRHRMDEESGERQLWQSAYSFVADRVRGIVTHRRIQHAFQQMREQFNRNQQYVQRQCEGLGDGQHSSGQNISREERMTEQRQFVLRSEENEVDYMATAAAECEMTSGAEAGCSCLMRFEEDQEGRVGLFASGSLPFSSCNGRVPEGTVGRGGTAAPLVSRAAAAVNPGKPSGDHGNISAEIELVNSRQNEREIDGLGDEQRWAKLQQDRRHHPSRNNTNQVAEADDGCNAAASPLSLVTGQQGNPNMTSLISASTPPPPASPTITAASAQSSCIACHSNDDYAGRADDTSLGHTASCVSMDTGVATSSGSTLDSRADSSPKLVNGVTGHGDGASERAVIRPALQVNQMERDASHLPPPLPLPIDPDSFNREHNKHGGAVENSEQHMAQTSAACSAGHTQIVYNSPINTQEKNQYFDTAETLTFKNSPADDQTLCFRTHVPNQAEPMSFHNANYQGYAGAPTHLHASNLGVSSDSSLCAQLSDGLIRENAGGLNPGEGGWYVYRGRGSDDNTITFPIDKVSHMHNGSRVYDGSSSSHFNNDAGSHALLNRDPDNEMVVDCCEQSLENHDAAPSNTCPSNNISSACHGGFSEQSNINVVIGEHEVGRRTGSENFQPNQLMEAQVMVVLDDLEHSMGTTSTASSSRRQHKRPRRSPSDHHQYRRRKPARKCTDFCNGHDVVFPSEMDSNASDMVLGEEATATTARSTCCSNMSDVQQTANATTGVENNLNLLQAASNRCNHDNLSETAMDVDLDQVDGIDATDDGDIANGAFGGGNGNATGGLIDSLGEWTSDTCSGQSSRRTQVMHGHLIELDQTDIFRELDAMCQCSIEDILADSSGESQADNRTDDLHEQVRQQSGNQGNCRHNTSDVGAVSSSVDNDNETREQRHSTSRSSPTQAHSRAQFRYGLPNLNLVQLFRNLLRNFYYETFIWMYLSVIMHPRSTTTRNRLSFLGLLSNQSMEAVLLNVLLGYFNGFHAGREATIRESCRVLGEISSRGGGYVNSRQAVWLRELAIDIGIHYNPRQMLRAFSAVVRDILMARVPPVYCVRYVEVSVCVSQSLRPCSNQSKSTTIQDRKEIGFKMRRLE